MMGISGNGDPAAEGPVVQQALEELGDILRNLRDPADIAFAAAQILGRWLRVSRVGYAAINSEAETLHVDHDWTAPGLETLAGVLSLRDYGSRHCQSKCTGFAASC